MATKTSSKQRTLPALKKGETYICAITGADGKGHHTILLSGDEYGPWADMMAAAKKRGGDLPDRVEQAVLYRDHKDKFQNNWYWSNTQYAGNDAYAWLQGFSLGCQVCYPKGNGCRCRAVRRVPIQ
jgi:hypothetical protein